VDRDPYEEELDALPEHVRLRIGALDIAIEFASMMRPRWSVEQAEEEIIALAEEILDFTYGGREERLAAMPISRVSGYSRVERAPSGRIPQGRPSMPIVWRERRGNARSPSRVRASRPSG
jgi:hypothetical protein